MFLLGIADEETGFQEENDIVDEASNDSAVKQLRHPRKDGWSDLRDIDEHVDWDQGPVSSEIERDTTIRREAEQRVLRHRTLPPDIEQRKTGTSGEHGNMAREEHGRAATDLR